VVGALVSTYLYLPFAMLMAVVSAVVLGVLGLIGGTGFTIVGALAGPAFDLPLLGRPVESFLLAVSGPLGALAGVLLGLVLGFLGALLLPWLGVFANDPLAGVGSVLLVVATGLFVGLVYTLVRVASESWVLRRSGARRMSRRERELIMPIMHSCTQRLGLASHPPVLIDDRPEPSATAHARHIVICQELLQEFQYDREVIAAVVCHELVHWRNGDPISAAFVRGVALPLYVVHGLAGWLVRVVGHPLFTVLIWSILWPVLVTVKYVIMPLQAADTRRAEFRADRGAALAGYADGLRQVLVRLPALFEGGRNGWTSAVGDTHPPTELRLEWLEDPSRTYPLPDREEGGGV
jgi:Zn-dependent protease with chaperone function